MISPQIWDSFSFAELSDLAKILFISLISHADDEGRGIAGAAYIKNITFPHDETRRVAEVQKALSEIALHTSTQFYQVEGRDYYALLNWTEYQKVDKPSKSKLPPPPSVGEGGAIRSREPFPESSANVRGTLPESSANKENIIEVNINNPSLSRTREENELKELPVHTVPKDFEIRLNAFVNKWGIVMDGYNSKIADVDFDALDKAFEKSPDFLQIQAPCKSMSWILKNYAQILSGKYAKFEKPKREGYDPYRIPWKPGAVQVIKGGEE